MSLSKIDSDVYITGSLTVKDLNVPAGAISDAQVNASAGIETTKMEHRYTPVHQQAGNATTETKAVHVVRGATATIEELAVGSIGVATGNATLTVDLKKNGATVLTGVVTLNSGNSARVAVTGSLNAGNVACVVGDWLETVLTATAGNGTVPTGAFAQIMIDEDPVWFTIDERYLSRKSVLGANPSQTNEYVLTGMDNEYDAQQTVLGFVPELWDSPTGFGFLPIASIECEQVCDTIFYATVVYSFTPPQQEGQETTSFDTGGATTHITQSLGTTAYAPSGKTAPNFMGAINVTKDGVQGVDIHIPGLQWQRTRRFDPSFVDNDYINVLKALTGTINQDEFCGTDPGETLFLGATGNQQNANLPWDITFRFASEENVTDLTVGNITGISKNGWQYLWVRYYDVDDTDSNQLVKQPLAAYVEDVYYPGDFSQLGIST